MTCGNCETAVKGSLLRLPDITNAEVSKDKGGATITMQKHIPLSDLQKAIGDKYIISAESHSEITEQTKGWLETYKPILLIFAYISTVSVIAARVGNEIHWIQCMNNFMAGFFLVFSFFKMLNISAFAESYAMYDIIAKRVKVWGFIYPFVELTLGIAYLIHFNPFITYISTIIIMGVSSIGVMISVLNKKKIQCACLGAVFNLPMSTVTIIEDLLMVVMATIMLIIF